MITSAYPLHVIDKVTEVFQKVSENPSPVLKPVGTWVGTWGKGDLECGIKGYTIVEIEEGKEGEGVRAISQSMRQFDNIEGYRYSVDLVLSAEEATGVRQG